MELEPERVREIRESDIEFALKILQKITDGEEGRIGWVQACAIRSHITSLQGQVEEAGRIEDGLRGLVTRSTKRTIAVLSAVAKIMHGQGIDSLEVDANILDHLEEWDNLADELDKAERQVERDKYGLKHLSDVIDDLKAKCALLEQERNKFRDNYTQRDAEALGAVAKCASMSEKLREAGIEP